MDVLLIYVLLMRVRILLDCNSLLPLCSTLIISVAADSVAHRTRVDVLRGLLGRLLLRRLLLDGIRTGLRCLVSPNSFMRAWCRSADWPMLLRNWCWAGPAGGCSYVFGPLQRGSHTVSGITGCRDFAPSFKPPLQIMNT